MRQVEPEDVFIAAVGASAGGLDALSEVFAEASPDAPVAWIVVQHLSPDHKSVVPQILARRTQLRVVQAEHLQEVAPGVVYVIPPMTQLRVIESHIELDTYRRERTMAADSVDVLFQTLARSRGSNAAAVILSGSGSDGSRGAQDVKAAGGLVVAQEPDTAGFDSMPRAAIRAGVVDRILTTSEIAKAIEEHARTGRVEVAQESEEELDALLRVASVDARIDFSSYKHTTLGRRAERRMRIAGDESLSAYRKRVAEDPIERRRFLRDVMIGVTHFFRDTDGFDELRQQLLVYLEENVKQEYRVWIVACSTGQEAYSVAMLLHDLLADRGLGQTFKLFATDVLEDAITTASTGQYSEAQVADIPTNLLNRYFARVDSGGYKVRGFLRESMLFSRHDATRDPPFSKTDLVVCRNMLIYLRTPMQDRVQLRLSYSLVPGGLLFLGPSENAPESHWDCLSPRWRIYRAVTRASRLDVEAITPRPTQMAVKRRRERELGSLHRAIGADYVPPHVVTTPGLEVIYVAGELQGLLAVPDGPMTQSLRAMVPRGLAVLLGEASERVMSGHRDGGITDVRYTEVRVEERGLSLRFDLRVRTAVDVMHHGPLIIFYFEGVLAPRPGEELPAPPLHSDVHGRAALLEQQLLHTEQNLQSTIEELESSNEELQATNEELLASNEELQSVNEELQSVNEELHSVNAEHQVKIVQLTKITAELDQLLQSTDAGVLFLDERLNVRRVNNTFVTMSGLNGDPVGRPLRSMFLELEGVSLFTACEETASSLEPVTSVVRRRGYGYLIQTRPIVGDQGFLGLVLTCSDITKLERLTNLDARLQTALNAANVPVAIEDHEGDLVFANEAFGRAVHRERRWLVGARIDDMVQDPSQVAKVREVVRSTSGWSGLLGMRFGGDTVIPLPVTAISGHGRSSLDTVVWFLDLPLRPATAFQGASGSLVWWPAQDRLVADPVLVRILGMKGPEATLEAAFASLSGPAAASTVALIASLADDGHPVRLDLQTAEGCAVGSFRRSTHGDATVVMGHIWESGA